MRSGLNIIIFRVLPVLGILLLGFVWLAPAFLAHAAAGSLVIYSGQRKKPSSPSSRPSRN